MTPSQIRSGVGGNCSLRPLKVPAFTIVDAMQPHRPDHAVDALFLVCALLAQTLGMDPHEQLMRARRQIADADSVRNPHFEAIRDYAQDELRKP